MTRPVVLALALLGLFALVAAGSYLGLGALVGDPDEVPPAPATPGEREREPDTPAATESPRGQGNLRGGGVPFTGAAVGLIGAVQSTRNLEGLLLQVNQIDVCTAPTLTAYLSITDEQGGAFVDARPGDFRVLVDGAEVRDFQLDLVRTEDLPLSTTLVIDHSGSMRGAPMEETKRAAIGYVERTAPDDTVGLVQFDTQVEVLSPPTADKPHVVRLIQGITTRSDTALHDAVATAVDTAPPCGRRAVVLMTDGRDTASARSLDEAVARANARNTPVFVVGLRSSQFTPEVLRAIADRTGAQYFEATTPADLDALYRRVDQQLAGQYVLRFRLDLPRTGAERRLRIETNVRGSPTVSERSFVY